MTKPNEGALPGINIINPEAFHALINSERKLSRIEYLRASMEGMVDRNTGEIFITYNRQLNMTRQVDTDL